MLVAVVLALSGVVAQGVLPSAPAVRAGTCDESLTLSPGGAGTNNTIDLPQGVRGSVYPTQTITVAGGNGTDYFWQVTNGSLPPGLVLESASGSPSGHDNTSNPISGTPTANGTYTVNLAVYDWPNYPAALPPSCLPGDSENYRITVHSGADITIVLDLVPDSGIDFVFTGDLATAFALDDDPAGSPPKQRTFHVMPGLYDVFESDPPNSGYSLDAINCTSGQTYDLPHRKMTLVVQDDSNVTCTFLNHFRRPDLEIALVEPGPYKGNGIYSTRPLPTQTQKRLRVPRGTYSYFIRISNDGPAEDNFRVKGSQVGPGRMKVTYFAFATDVTSQINAGLWETGGLSPGSFIEIEVQVEIKRSALSGDKMVVKVSAGSVNLLSQVDLVKAVTTRR
jgi:hypothetical protein